MPVRGFTHIVGKLVVARRPGKHHAADTEGGEHQGGVFRGFPALQMLLEDKRSTARACTPTIRPAPSSSQV